MDSTRARRYPEVPVPECGITDWPDSLGYVSFFRRRDLILTGASGPFGIGIDLQAAIVAAHLNRSEKIGRSTLTKESLNYAKSTLHNISSLFRKPSLQSCFEWDETKDGFPVIKRNDRGAICQKSKPWSKMLRSILKGRESFITAPLTCPTDRKGEFSTLASDWLDYHFLGKPLTDWLKLEAASILWQCHEQGRLFGHTPFPALRSLVPEVLNNEDEPILQAAPGYTFVHIKWNDPLIHTLKCTLFAAYLLHRRYEHKKNTTPDWVPLFSPEYHYDDPACQLDREVPDYYQKLHSSSYAKEDAGNLAIIIDDLPPETIFQIRVETLESFRLSESFDAYSKRIERCDGKLSPRLLDLLYWAVLAEEFGPLMTAAELLPSTIPMSIYKAGRGGHDTKTFKDSPLFFRSPNIDELMLATVSAHFGAKDLAAESEISPTALNARNQYSGWSIVNHLHSSKYEYFYAPGRGKRDSFLKIRQAFSDMPQTELLKKLVTTNAVSCTGRIGKPIHYYEWIDFDARQLAEDVKVFTSYAMLSAGYDVVLVSQRHLVIQIPLDEADGHLPEIEKAYRAALARILSTAFPSTNTPVGIHEYFVAPEVTCKTDTVYPSACDRGKDL